MVSNRFGKAKRFDNTKKATASVGASAAPRAKLAERGTSTGNK